MGKEIEKKFLLKNDNWKSAVVSTHEIKQGYLNSTPERVVRLRIKDQIGVLTIKGKMVGLTRPEFEYEIPYTEALEILKLCESGIISKTRYIVVHNQKNWEIDIFHDENEGLKVAEIELESESETFDLPDWTGEEVSSDARYLNSNLISSPYKNWDNIT